MRPVTDPDALMPGATLYHSAFGFARVRDTEDDAVMLDWERPGAHLPERVRYDNLRRVYALCAPNGFFHRAVHDQDAIVTTLHERATDALVWLLEDLAGPQRLRDIMDWLVGRELFTPKTFVRWWATTEAAVRADPRLRLDGEWLHRADDESDPPSTTPLSQLDPDAMASRSTEHDLSELLDDDTTETSEVVALDESPTVEVYLPLDAVPLADAHPPSAAWPAVGHAVARSIADAVARGHAVRPTGDTLVLRPDGSVGIEPAAFVESMAPSETVRLAAILMLEAFLGRGLPAGVDPARLLPHTRHRRPDLPPTALAPLAAALLPDPEARPSPAEWLASWAEVAAVERMRVEAGRPNVLLRAGYDSHIGRVKLMQTQVNQDAMFVGARGPETLAVVADGISLSDAGRGDQASRLAVQTLAHVWSRLQPGRVASTRLVDRALVLANKAICDGSLDAADGDLTGRMPMGTTILVVHANGNRVHLAWLGDSRAYLVGPWGAAQLTADDNVSGAAFEGWCDGSARAWHPEGHALVRYLGHFDTHGEPAPFQPHHTSLVLAPGERLLLLTDGITDYIAGHEAELVQVVAETGRHGTPDMAARALVNLANGEGGGDNATAVILEYPADA